MVQKILKTEADIWYNEVKTGKSGYPSNVIHSYFALYDMLNEERDAILKYEEEIRKV